MRSQLISAFLAGALLACGNDVVIDPVEEAPAALELVTPPPESVVAGEPLSPAPIVELRTSAGERLARPGERVVASVSNGAVGGTTSVLTDDQGRATFTDLTITSWDMVAELRFTCCNVPSVTRMVSLTFGTDVTTISAVSPTSGFGRAGSEMVPGPSVIVTDGHWMPVEGAVVHFSTNDPGVIPAGSVVTNAEGIAQLPSYRFSDIPGTAILFARLDGTSRQARFELSSIVGGEVAVLGEGFSYAGPAGERFLLPPIQITDGGVPQAGVDVRFSWTSPGGGELYTEHHFTGPDGKTAGVALPLLATPGTNDFDVFVIGYPGPLRIRVYGGEQLPLRFVSNLPANVMPLEDSNGRILLTLKVLNAADAPVPAVPITFPWDETNGIVDWLSEYGPDHWGPSGSDGNGEMVLSWRVPTDPGTYRITISSLAIAEPLTFTAIRE